MHLLAQCPHCRHEFPIAPRFRGQEVACVACDERFSFTDGPELPDTGEEYVVETAAEDGAEPDINVELVPTTPSGGRFRRAARLILFCVVPAFVAGGGAVYVWYRMHPRATDTAGPETVELGWPVVDARLGFDPETVLTLHVSGADNEYVREEVLERAGSLAGPGGARTSRAYGSDERMTVVVAPVGDPQAAARKIDFGVVESVRGRTITVRANPVPGPPPGADAVERALFDLQSAKWIRQRDAIERLKTLPADHRRKTVARALEQALADPRLAFPADDVLEALGAWGTEDDVPAIENFLKRDEAAFSLRTALMALAKIRGKRALEIIMASFDRGNGFGFLDGQNEARPAIIAFGPGAEDGVLERFRPDDPGRHVVICQILKEIGTQKCIPLLEAAVARNPFLEPHARAAAQSIQARRK
jgi:hypothetical protein